MDYLEKHILQRLFNRKCVGAKHTAVKNCFGGLAKHDMKQAKNAFKMLANKQYLILKPTNYGLQVSLNVEKLDEIRKNIDPSNSS